MMPKPLQPGGVPIWVSGRINARVVARLCRFGLRWIPWGDDAAELDRSIPELRARIAAAGVDPDGLQVVANLRVFTTDDGTIDVDRTLAPVAAAVAAGATDFLTRFRARGPDDRVRGRAPRPRRRVPRRPRDAAPRREPDAGGATAATPASHSVRRRE